MKTLVVGLGEIGSALYAILYAKYKDDIEKYDIKGEHKISVQYDLLHICIPGSLPDFKEQVAQLKMWFEPKCIIVHSTVKPGTCKELSNSLSIPVLHSPTRGKHPVMATGMLTYIKYLGYDGEWTKDMGYARIQLEDAGIKTTTVSGSITTEVGKILETTRYGVNLMWADMEKELCDHYGVSYAFAVENFVESYNEGVKKVGTPNLQMQVLTPPEGHIGGHCVVENTYLLDVHNFRTKFIIDNIQRMKK